MLDDFAGHVFDEKYRVDRKLGEGGMGAVYLATHVGTKRPVALKLIAPRLVASDEFLERFRREAEAAGRLRHPNVVNVTDFGLTTVEGSRTAYLVMEYLDGESLRSLLQREPAPPIDFVVDVLEQTALAVDEAHRHGIVHRDLKPDNIWLQPDGRGSFNVKVLDFGLAKIHGGDGEPAHPAAHSASADTRMLAAPSPTGVAAGTTLAYGSEATDGGPAGELTRVGSVLGTPAYMSPEQCSGEVADGRSDVYSLAVIAFEMLAGELPFKGESFVVMAQHVGTAPPRLAARRTRATAGIADLVARGMAKAPAQRPATATAFAAALRARTVTGAQVLRRAVALYSEHFPAFIRLSLFGNVPLLAIGAMSLLAVAWVRVGAWQAALFFGCMMLGVLYPYAANRATFAVALERLRERPLSRLDSGEVLRELTARLGGAGGSRVWLAARMLAFAPRSAKLVLAASIPAEVVERLGRREANERSRLLLASVREALRTVALFGLICYAVPTTLFFLATLGVTQAAGLDLSTATSVSFAVAIGVMGMNVVWLIPPAHIALVSLYFHAREASGEVAPLHERDS